MKHVTIRIEYVQISHLMEWKGSPRFISDQQLQTLRESVRRYRVVVLDPLIVDQRYRIVAGHRIVSIKRWGQYSRETAIRVGPGSAVGGSS